MSLAGGAILFSSVVTAIQTIDVCMGSIKANRIFPILLHPGFPTHPQA